MKNNTLLWPLLMIFLLVSSCKDDDTDTSPDDGNVHLEITHQTGDESLELHKTYTNAYGNDFKVTQLKYFISNIGFVQGEDTTYVPKPYAYHLVTATGNTTYTIEMQDIAEGHYDHMFFSIGVDQSANHDISRNEGDLDPGGADGMIWNWDTGYKFMVLEGEYTVNNEPEYFVFHVGHNENYKRYGFRKSINIQNGEVTTIAMKADVQQLFTGPNTINLEETNTAHGNNAGIIAENYGTDFITLP